MSTSSNKLTKAQWAWVKERAESGRSVELKVDGYEVDIQMERHKMRMVYALYINGQWRGTWWVNKTEEVTKFFPTRKVWLFSAKKRKEITKELGKKAADRLGVNKFNEYHIGHHTSFTSIKKVFEANNSTFEIIDDAYNG